MSNSKYLIELAKIIAQSGNECIIFVGAGLSRPLHYPSWGIMLEKLAEIALTETAFTPESRSRIGKYITTKDQNALLSEMSEINRLCKGQYLEKLKIMFSPRADAINFLQAHSSLLTLVDKYIKGIITTNFDFCLECARDDIGFNNITNTDTIDDFIGNNKKQILHLHGSRNDLSKCVVCGSNYAELYTTDFQSKLENILSSYTVLYLGTSLGDYELGRILERRTSLCIPSNASRFPDMKTHYAFLPIRNDINIREEKAKMLNQLKINVEHYEVLPGDITDEYGVIENHKALYDMIEELRAECEKYQVKTSVRETVEPLSGVKK